MSDDVRFDEMTTVQLQQYMRDNKETLTPEQRHDILKLWQQKSICEKKKAVEEANKTPRKKIQVEIQTQPILQESTMKNPPSSLQELYKNIDYLHGIYQKKLALTLIPYKFWDWMIDESSHSSIALEQAKMTDEEQENFIKLCIQQDKNYKQAFLDILTAAFTEPHLTHDIVIGTASTLMKDIEPEHRNYYRKVSVQMYDLGIAVQNPASIPLKMTSILREIEEGNKSPIQKALDIHYNVIFIQPFIDSNKRTARLLANYYLIKNDYPPILISPKDQAAYLDAMIELKKTGNPEKYETFMLSNLETTLKRSIERLDQLPIKNFSKLKATRSER